MAQSKSHAKHHHTSPTHGSGLQLLPIYNGLSPQMKAAILEVNEVYQKHVKHNPHITGAQEWYGHCAWSLHHTGYAVDFRTIDLPGGGIGETANKIKNEVIKALGRDYYVLLHQNKPYHLHVQYRKGVKATLVPAGYAPVETKIA